MNLVDYFIKTFETYIESCGGIEKFKEQMIFFQEGNFVCYKYFYIGALISDKKNVFVVKIDKEFFFINYYDILDFIIYHYYFNEQDFNLKNDSDDYLDVLLKKKNISLSPEINLIIEKLKELKTNILIEDYLISIKTNKNENFLKKLKHYEFKETNFKDFLLKIIKPINNIKVSNIETTSSTDIYQIISMEFFKKYGKIVFIQNVGFPVIEKTKIFNTDFHDDNIDNWQKKDIKTLQSIISISVERLYEFLIKKNILTEKELKKQKKTNIIYENLNIILVLFFFIVMFFIFLENDKIIKYLKTIID